MQFMIEDLLTAVSAVTQSREISPRRLARREIPGMDSGDGGFQQIDPGNQEMFAAPRKLAESGIAATYRGEAQPKRMDRVMTRLVMSPDQARSPQAATRSDAKSRQATNPTGRSVMFRRVIKFAVFATLAGSAALATPASAQEKYPVDTVTMVTHSSPGGGSDVYLREMIQFLAPAMKIDFGVENVKGGSGAKAIAKVATSPADGSIFYAATPTYINMSLLSNPDYSYKDVEPVVNFFLDPQVLYVRKDSPFTSFADVIAAAKSQPGNQKWGTGSPASLERQALEKFKVLAGVDVTIITHDGGGDMMINVLNGSLDLGIGEIQEFRGQLDAGEVRVIGVFTEQRLPEFPDAKTAKEEGIDMVVNKFRGIVGPKGLPPEVIQAWEAAIPKVLDDPEFQKWYRAAALVPAYMPHDKFVPFVEGVVTEQQAFFKEYGIKTMD